MIDFKALPADLQALYPGKQVPLDDKGKIVVTVFPVDIPGIALLAGALVSGSSRLEPAVGALELDDSGKIKPESLGEAIRILAGVCAQEILPLAARYCDRNIVGLPHFVQVKIVQAFLEVNFSEDRANPLIGLLEKTWKTLTGTTISLSETLWHTPSSAATRGQTSSSTSSPESPTGDGRTGS
jgi:hypothetical protein